MTLYNSQSLKSVQHLSEHVNGLNGILDKILHVLNAQKEAVITSNIQQVEDLTQEHYRLRGNLKKVERAFINELKKMITVKTQDLVRISTLKQYYPGAEESIDLWRQTLLDKTNLIEKKHQQVINLLEFAMLRNSNMMKTIYALHNEKNTHYSMNGNKANVMNGIAVNQKV